MTNYTIEPFETLDEGVQQEINHFTKRVTFKKGETLFTNGELNRYFYVIQKGKIKNYQLNLNNAKEQTIFIFREGDMFDTIILLDGEVHDVMYEAMEETVAFEMPIENVRHMIEHNPEFNRKFFPYLAKQMRHMEELVTDISLYSTEERLIKLLLQNLDPSNILKYNLLQGLSNTEIAKLIGTVRHVVERHLKKLKKDGLLEAKSKRLQINNANKLLERIKLF
jgi:CRP-like cAMP-binding protein